MSDAGAVFVQGCVAAMVEAILDVLCRDSNTTRRVGVKTRLTAELQTRHPSCGGATSLR